MDDGESRLQEFIRAEQKRGDLCNLTDASGPPNQSPPDLCQQHPTCAYRIKSRKCYTLPYCILVPQILRCDARGP